MQRDYFIDFIKGITIINIVIIHSVYHPIIQFPAILKDIVLLIDVPIFFLCSGITSSSNIKKTVSRLLKLQISFILFLILVFIASSIYQQEISFKILFSNIIHNYKMMPPFHYVLYSLWYFKVYFLVAILGVLIISFTQNTKRIYIICSILLLLIVYFSFQNHKLNTDSYSTILFYLFIFLIGYNLKNKNINKMTFLISIIFSVSMLLLWFSLTNQPKSIQYYKFPPHIIYLIFSIPAIITVLYLRQRLKITPQNIFIYPGQNSLFFYFAQGIAVSLTVGVASTIMQYKEGWYFTLSIILILNLAITYILARTHKSLDSLMWKGVTRIKRDK